MDVFEPMKKRHSVRQYENKPIEEELPICLEMYYNAIMKTVEDAKEMADVFYG